MPKYIPQILSVAALLLTHRSWADGVVQAVNQRPESLAVLREAARASGMSVRVTDAKTAPLNAELLAWEVRKGDDSSLTKARADQIQAYVQSGGNLLVSCGLLTWDQLYRLTAVCPTTGWHGLCGRHVDGEQRVNKDAAVVRWNTEMYGGLDLTGSRIRYHYSIRPFHQVERGIQRYERYEATWRHLGKGFIFTIQDRNYALPANHTFWTRPLMNRSWRNEVVLDNIDGTALLMTGRCGRGKVAVLATAISETADWDECQALWCKTLDWLKTKDDFEEDLPPPGVPSADESVVASVPGDTGISLELLEDRPTRSLGVRLINDSDRNTPAEIVIRVSTWQRALVKDLSTKVVVPPL